ncbi:TPA_asm: coat protein [ssRNA phage Gerhypos.1_36]|uniref:Coat protein n=2 Tax=Leviviricetes TaxID=2842243 RepID=A0A8S5KY04_9VIRU|nr:coat protein [ssRNA phage Gerhypos.1_36]QDH88101.1 MAG: hypothetical protein H1Bulk30186_000002 [Leviviridae sp.]DAD49991.1 TPA_asm: coat protein [ssRNA phage Gerhypos.1_36]
MAYSDPQTVTIDSVANSLARTATGANTGAFTLNDGSIQLSVAHTYGKRTRRTARITHKKIVSDPLLPSTNVPVSMSFYVVADVPVQGYSVDEIQKIITGFTTWMTASSGANITKLLGGEI